MIWQVESAGVVGHAFSDMTPSSMRVAVLVPCFNEEAAVAAVVADFRKALPSAEIFVYDNNSSDRTGNWMLTSFLSSVFGQAFKDILSGYRVFSRRFVKSFPVLSDGFEIETELSVHALELALPVAEIETPYYARPVGSVSKLNTWRDGFRILGTILKLYRSEKPLKFFTAIGIILALLSIVLAFPIVITYLEQGVVPRLPTAVLSMGLMILAVLSVSSGLVL